MPRPRKRRRLARVPKAGTYKPAGIALHKLKLVLLLSEELEALRLADLEGQTQVEAARQMGISRSTFQRILTRARQQVALALVEGRALQIEPVADDENGEPRGGPRRKSPQQERASERQDEASESKLPG
jgi:uncharacterized protein